MFIFGLLSQVCIKVRIGSGMKHIMTALYGRLSMLCIPECGVLTAQFMILRTTTCTQK